MKQLAIIFAASLFLASACPSPNQEKRPESSNSGGQVSHQLPSDAPSKKTSEAVDPWEQLLGKDVKELLWRHPQAGRIIAIGDLHGDVKSFERILKKSQIIDQENRWIGGNATLVQVGDQLDRGDEEPEIIHLLHRLEQEAEKAGGKVVVLNGNHELMNVAGDFRYVTQDGFQDFFDADHPHRAIKTPEQGRAHAFRAGGPIARWFAAHPVIAVVGDTAFAHGGISPEHATQAEAINLEMRKWLLNGGQPPPSLFSDSAPIWIRRYSQGQLGGVACEEIAQVLAILKVKRVVVAHTIQEEGITSSCEGSIYRIDVGLSNYYSTPRLQALEIKSDPKSSPMIISEER